MDEETLAGGTVSTVVRIGDTVRRTPGPRPGFVRDLLVALESAGWPGAPRHLGTDPAGREVLSFLPGYVAWQDDPPAAVRAEPALTAVAVLVRQFHDLTAGSALAGDREVVCHNDLAPRNTVYADGFRPAAFIDWDLAAPGDRIADVAHVCWQYVPLRPGTDPARAARTLAAVADAYDPGRELIDRGALLDTVLWWQDRCRRGIEIAADAGDPAMVRLRERGAVRAVRAAYEWTAAHRATLSTSLA